MRARILGLATLATLSALACSSDPDPKGKPPVIPCEGLAAFRFEGGGDGHADPFGAKAAGQARAGKIRDASQIVEGAFGRHRARIGDFVLANDRIAAYVEAENRPNGYAPFGGDLLSIEPVGADGRPRGFSLYNETLITLSRQTVKPEKVSVIADGSDGKAAIVRVSGVLANVPFLDTFKALSTPEYGFPAAVDFVLEPGAEKLGYRLSFANTTTEPVSFERLQRVGFFHANRNQIFTEGAGFGPPAGAQPWVAFTSGESAFFFRTPDGRPLNADISVSGFQTFTIDGLEAGGCEKKVVDYLEIATGGPGLDGLLETKRRVLGEPAGREIRGTLREEGGVALGGAFIHATNADGKYVGRVATNDAGQFVLHVPAGAAMLTPTRKGWAVPAATAANGDVVDLSLPKRATIEIKATDSTTGEALPVRVQVIPTTPIAPAPASFGLREEVEGRLWQDFAITGTTSLPVPPGAYRVIVSRGYEYELLDTPVTADPAATAVVEAKLARSVDTSGVMCADFHIHSFYSVDSSDPVDEKVKAAIADGLDIPVSSEHEWIVDFQPIIQRLGLTKWAFGMPSEELTSFVWGHFGVVPIYPRPDAPNNGAIDWVGKTPASVFQQVSELPEKPVLIVNHPNGAPYSSYFTAAEFNRGTLSGNPELWSENFGAIEVFNDSDFEANRTASVADWFALLNGGRSYWAAGNSDTHDQRTSHAGYPRTCLRFGHDDPQKLTPEVVRDVLRSGAATISGGLYMTAEGPSGVGPGGTSTPGSYSVVVAAPSWLSATSLEVIVDGITVSTLPLTASPSESPGKRYEVTVDVAASQSKARHWVVFHAKGEGDLSPLHPGRKPFAVSNPIFF